MTDEMMHQLRRRICEQVDEVERGMTRLSPLDLFTRMNAIQKLAGEHGLAAVEGLARSAAQLALLPGHRIAMRSALEHLDEAFDCASDRDTTAMLAALAVRLH